MRQSTPSRFRLPIALLFLAALLLVVGLPARAQTPADRLEALGVELWPDYDRPAMLVLLTGTLPAEAALPATVTIPLPADADVNAVASFNASGALMSDVDYTVEDGQITLDTPAARFRVEYYAPYEVDGNAYSYTFDWLADVAVDAMTVIVQQPLAAVDFQVTPAAESSGAVRGDSLTYHTLPTRAVGAGEPFAVEIVYTVDAPVLSAPPVPTLAAGTGTSTATSTIGDTGGDGFNPLWLLAVVGALALIGAAWYLGQRQGRARARNRKPQPTRPAKTSAAKPPAPPAAKPPAAARYCHNCGQPAQPNDTFCRHCGTQLKGE